MTKISVAIVVSIVSIAGIALWIYADASTAKLLLPLLLTGGVASVVQGLIEKQNVLAIPTRVDDGHYDLGFVSDLLIGMVGAFASLIVGLAVLNDRFFADLPTSGATGGEVDADTTAQAFAQLVTMIPTWVRIASFGALTGYASRRLLPDLANKIAGMVAGALDKEVAKQVQNRIESERGQAELLAMTVEAIKAQTPAVQANLAARAAGAADPLGQLVQQFTAINIADYRQRVARKRELADQMPAMAFASGVSVADIAAKVDALPAGAPELDAWLAALTSVIALAASPGDGARLLRVIGRARQKFVIYRALLALGSLKSRQLLNENETEQALTYIDGRLEIGDERLTRKAQSLHDLFVMG